ncbi:hypothetical protein I553_3723 [Mycobacterium xenopi 4042]|uniref:Uncharacterized protein n=1 Tax=Mycobacterium xenopi 4042 TaxID=1299334 RepID=X7YR96_MYCXE|nr:hypothetical protein I553_3723 [Mycobacterium xenopi 4042]
MVDRTGPAEPPGQEFQLAVTDYLNAVENATFGQEHQEAVNQASFL